MIFFIKCYTQIPLFVTARVALNFTNSYDLCSFKLLFYIKAASLN